MPEINRKYFNFYLLLAIILDNWELDSRWILLSYLMVKISKILIESSNLFYPNAVTEPKLFQIKSENIKFNVIQLNFNMERRYTVILFE